MSMDASQLSYHLNDVNKDSVNMTIAYNSDYNDSQKAIMLASKGMHRRNKTSDEEGYRIAQELTDKMKQDRIQRKQIEAERRKAQREKMKQEQVQVEKRQKELDQQKEKERKEKMMQIKEKEEMRKKQIKDNEEIYRENLKKIEKVPLYKKIEVQYEKEYVIPELEKRKKELADKRNFFKPISKEEITVHEKKYEELRKREMVKREQKYKDDNDYDPSKYKSKFLENVLDYDESKKIEQNKKYEEVAELMKKKKNYAKLVLETHKPKVSKRKKMEMELIKQNLENPTAFERIKKRMVSSSQNRLNTYKALNSSNMDEKEHTEQKKPKYKDFDWREKNRIVEIPKPEHKFIKKDYLTEKRIQRTNQSETRSEQKKHIDWETELNKFEGDDKVFHMKEKARMLEQEALKKEQLMKVNKGDHVSGRNEINDMIIDSIKAKIALLDYI